MTPFDWHVLRPNDGARSFVVAGVFVLGFIASDAASVAAMKALRITALAPIVAPL